MPATFPRCVIVPLPDDQVSFTIDGVERLRWHAGTNAPRPFFYPLLGPSGLPLTRMGHPGAPNHDHHRSIWFAHHKVLGIDFWGYTSPARIRQLEWLAYHDGEEEAVMGVKLGWFDGHDPKPLMTQDVIAAVRPLENEETLLEIQTTLTPTADMIELEKTNFGLLAVRVAKSLSAHFGSGQITDSEGRVGEPAIFGQRAAWMDYSGPIRPEVVEGITFYDHPENPGHPTHWHVREDGWMGASLCFAEGRVITKAEPLRLRYLLHGHRGGADAVRARQVGQQFADRSAFTVAKAKVKHEAWTISRGGRSSA